MEIINVEKIGHMYTKVTFKNKKGNEIEYEFHYNTNNGNGDIIRNGVDYAGIICENNRLIDYDMVYELNKAAIKTLRKAGITVPRDFEN